MFITGQPHNLNFDRVVETGMMTTAKSDDPAKVQQVQLITRSNRRGNIADKSLQRSPAAEHSNEHVSRIDLRQPARRQLQHIVRSVVRQHAHDDDVTSARSTVPARYI